jgi:hypothetical protein
MTHDTTDIAAFIVELTERTPAKERTMQMFDLAVDRKFPGVDVDQLYAAHEIAAASMKAIRRRRSKN